MERFASSVPCGTDEWNRDAGLHLGSFRDRWSGLLRWARSWGGGAPGGRSEGTRASYFQRQASRRELVALGGALTVPARAWPEEFVLNPGAEIWVQSFREIQRQSCRVHGGHGVRPGLG